MLSPGSFTGLHPIKKNCIIDLHRRAVYHQIRRWYTAPFFTHPKKGQGRYAIRTICQHMPL